MCLLKKQDGTSLVKTELYEKERILLHGGDTQVW